MLLISHRGNIKGVNPKLENSPSYITNALNEGFDVEVDVFYENSKIYLGHDAPQYEVDENFIKNKKIWCHAKTIEAMFFLSKINCIYYWHQNDDITLTSNGYFWTFPGKQLTSNSIAVLPERFENFVLNKNVAGICSDFITKYLKK